MRRLETFDWWPRLVADKDDLSLRELAEKYGVTPGAISAALKRQGITRKPAPPGPRAHRKKAARRTDDELPPEPGEAPRKAERRIVRPDPDRQLAEVAPERGVSIRPGSKDEIIARHLDLVGSMPDRDAAEKIGVSVRTLASFRARNDIPAYSGPRRKRKAGGRRSKIDAYRDLLGTVPDRVVAEKAGVTINAVRNYRVKYDIPAARRGRVTAVSSGPVPRTKGAKAWKVRFQVGGGSTSRVVLADDLDAALQRARGASVGNVVGIDFIADAL